MNSGKKWRSRFVIVIAGFALGSLARFIWPPETENPLPTRKFNEPLVENSIRDLPIIEVDGAADFPVPIEIP